jgi:cbb3-type cytochrome oxidase subunit 3
MDYNYKVPKAIFTLFVLFITALIFVLYQAYVVVPREKMSYDREKMLEARELEDYQNVMREERYSECMDTAYSEYQLDFDAECRRLGKGDGCAMSVKTADAFADMKDKKEDRCVALYKVK